MELSGDLNDVVTINDSDDNDATLFCTASGSLVDGMSGAMHFNVSIPLTMVLTPSPVLM